MDLPEAERWLDSHLNREAVAGRIEGLALRDIEALLHVLGDPHRQYPVVHVTGTNGKGSVTRMAAVLLAAHGLSVGAYTSPHLQRTNERLWWSGEDELTVDRDGKVTERPGALAGGDITDDELAQVLTEVARAEPLAGVTASWFELVTAAAFTWFAGLPVDVAVVEVGLLGRFDATNAADGTVAVITNVGRDHTDGAEGWREAVAGEKAGIIKAGAAVVLGDTDPAVRRVVADEVAAVAARTVVGAAGGGADVDDADVGRGDGPGPPTLLVRGVDFDVEADAVAVGGHLVEVRTPRATYEDLFVPAHGAHQGLNAAVAVAAVEAFFGRALDPDLVRDALATVRLPGRLEVLRHAPLLVIDGAHNPEGAAAAAEALDEEFDVAGRRILVVGMLSGRDPAELLRHLDVGRAALVVACTPDSPRAVPAAEVAAAARALGVDAVEVPDVAAALAYAEDEAAADDAILVAGSLYVAGAARTAFGL